MSKITLSEKKIASLVEGDLFISTGAEVSGLNSLDNASGEQASFLGNEKYYNDFLQTKAALVFAPPLLQEAPDGVAIIHVENPSLAFAKLAEHLAHSSDTDYSTSPDAIVADSADYNCDKVAIMGGAVIGQNVKIGDGSIIHPGVVISDDAKIGENVLIYPNCVVREECEVGNNVILQPGCVIGSDGYGFDTVDGVHRKVAQIGIVVIEDDVEVGANSTIDRARFGKTTIKRGTKIDNLVQIAHNVTIGEDNLIVAQVGVAGSAETERNVIIGAQSGVAGHIKICANTTLAGQSGFVKDMTTPGVYHGTPARLISESRKSRALVNRLPKLLERIKELEKKVAQLEEG